MAEQWETEKWERIAFEVARNQVGPRLPATELCMNLALTPYEFEMLCEDDLFARKVRAYAKELTENGTSFALKAQVQAEELLKTQFRIAKDKDTPPSVAIAAIQNTVRWAGFDKRPADTAGDQSNMPRISIKIDLGAAGQPRPEIDVTPAATPLE